MGGQSRAPGARRNPTPKAAGNQRLSGFANTFSGSLWHKLTTRFLTSRGAKMLTYLKGPDGHTSRVQAVARRLRGRFWREEAGGISIMYAIVLPALLGLVGLGVETGFWYVEKRTLQTQADAGALAGVWELAWNREDEITPSATNEAERNGFPNNPAFTTITVNHPPVSGDEAGNQAAIEVIVTQD